MIKVYDERSAGQRVIRLIRFSDDEFMVLTSNSQANIQGTLVDASRALHAAGVSFRDLEAAHTDLLRSGNNVAEFGVLNFAFMFSHFDPRFAQKYGVA